MWRGGTSTVTGEGLEEEINWTLRALLLAFMDFLVLRKSHNIEQVSFKLKTLLPQLPNAGVVDGHEPLCPLKELHFGRMVWLSRWPSSGGQEGFPKTKSGTVKVKVRTELRCSKQEHPVLRTRGLGSQEEPSMGSSMANPADGWQIWAGRDSLEGLSGE